MRDDGQRYSPAWWLPGPHSRTIWGRLARREPDVATSVRRVETDDGDFVELHRLAAPAEAPRLLILHGLEGSRRSHYVRALLAYAAELGWGADVMIFRSCGREMNRTSRLYHSGETRDLDHVVGLVLREFPDAPLTLAGVSLGGNVLLKWLGERGEDTPPRLRGAATVSVPYDLALSSRRIATGFSRVYERTFLRSLLRKAASVQRRFPGAIADAELRSIRSMWDFDDQVTAPLHGFADAQDYYSRCSSIGFLSRVRVPTLLLSAADDPFLPPEVLDRVRELAVANPFLHLEIVERGGHVGFVSGRNPLDPFYYAEWRVATFLKQRVDGGA